MRQRGMKAALVVLAAAVLTAGCGLTKDRYRQVAPGMPAAEVRQILGEPRYEFVDEWVYTRDDPRDLTKVTIAFDGGRVVGKSWVDPEHPDESDRTGPVP